MNWKNRLVDMSAEFIMVTFGILAAFGLNAWYVENEKNEEARKYLMTIEQNLNTDIQALNDLLAARQLVNSNSQYLLECFKARKVLDRNKFQSAMFSLPWEDRFISQQTGFQALRNAGKLELLSADVESAMYDYYAVVDRMTIEEASYNTAIQRHVETFLISSGIDVSTFDVFTDLYENDTRTQKTDPAIFLKSKRAEWLTTITVLRLSRKLIPLTQDLIVKARSAKAVIDRELKEFE